MKLMEINGEKTIDVSHITHIAILMVILTLVSKCLGFVREMVMAAFYGTSYITDAYVMAQAIPGILFGGIFGAIATAYMPLYSKIIENNGMNEGNKFTSQVINILVVFSLISSVVGFIFSDQLVNIFAGGFTEETAALTSFYVKITFAYVLFSSTTGVIEAHLQYKGSFLIPIISGYLQNIMLIVVIIISAYTSHYYLAFGLLLGSGIRFLAVFIYAKKKQFKYSMSFKFTSLVKEIMIASLPVFVGTYIQQINVFVDKTLAAGLQEGSVSALNYGMLLVGLITGLTTSILTTILYPKIARANAVGDYNSMSEIIKKGTTIIILISCPFSLGAMLYSREIVQIIYERGAFDTDASSITSSAFFYYAMGILFIALNDFLTKIYYSIRDMKAPMIFAGISVILNIILNLILVRYMEYRGLALATSISFISNTIMLCWGLRKKHSYIKVFKEKTKLVKIVLSAIIAVAISYIVYNWIINLLAIRLMQLAISIAISIIVYLGLLSYFKIDEVKMIKKIKR